MQQSMPSIQNADPETLVAEQDLGRLISFLRSKIATHIDAQLDCMDLTSAQYIVVVLLARGSVNTLAGLSDHMVYDKGAMSRLLKRLEEKDLIEKTQCEFDKRSTLLSLSDKGKALYPQIMPLVNQVYEKALSGFSENEKHSVMDLLNRAINNLDTPS
ncbi:MarR family transcriptional regulator [Pseudoalteromonas sp. S979]|jgi:DNA-binding MarR family transcriptional regulator|uniref:MarR family winged helix-turn-helix transcriptional regulator n=2 Tax=Pseudoalteromonas TaxID=53246 RepID=UPI0002C9020B|nr:MarR family transcriptional regulator [Pseudoalteromonas sp. S980]ENO00468.1 transcription regulator protein [Pseudoalteromonas agarivorans S816]MCP4059259.1 MarR family transcriptional regulator [Pseudoalteromonas sp.]TMS65855.1 MarR family transcriptional regulator [Pseudoalteromonas sp. S1691]TMS68103.1 MarR family transcriptional regulator [Pseudoalteromonas sp. S1731]TMS74291.1 MarR family transcriptional regulator [Pseudoalteromonas sp. S1941]TMS78844.1 MarR family transcriptional re|tara:strand:- start:998 stop:1471 length:474 start_codon:yes stop_codon:yes gene_type:complete